MTSGMISPKELSDRLSDGQSINLIDVRTPVEFRELHVQGAQNIPLDRLNADDIVTDHDSEQPLYVICRTGGRAKQACDRLHQAGLSKVINVEGGTQACESAGLPVVRGKRSMSLERQVRIAAGSLVVLGVILSYIVHPYLVGLSAFVGAGLVFAGITDTCAMGMLIAKMPWNRVSGTN